ncbi:potassium channel family protein [Amycolatopsis granulosa]|uniref:potassium channel family protein n=1 Tax=Amycolatopsis granulosa TaxID=185684 RepID=UPI00141EF36F|nr:potassium channel family protein [Amycolatopsis granulosa]NIH83824.1 hypothetical protein [Amycolatopsis granulosa]
MTLGEGRARAHRGRLLVLGALRPSFTVAAYYLLPLGDRVRGRGALFLVAGLVVVALVVVWEVRAIGRSPYPLLQGVQALALSVPLFLLLFAEAYHVMELVQPGSFTVALSKTDALYFVVTVFATVGFGDITPVASTARILVTVQMLGDLLLLGLGLRVILTAVQRGRDRTDRTGGHGDRDRDLRTRDDR